jgi:hypothetical protein
MSFDPNKPYNDLPQKAELETKAVLRKAIAANKALAGDLILKQGVLINAIVLQEAKLSSLRLEFCLGVRLICLRDEHISRICRKK